MPLFQPSSSNNPYLSDPDVKLMLDFQSGETCAFESLMEKYYRRILNFIYRYLNNREVAEDLTQEVFIKVYHAQHSYQPKAQFRTWIYTIAKNLALNEVKKQRFLIFKDQESLKHFEDENVSSAHQTLADQEMVETIRKAIGELPENQRMAMIFYRYENFSYEEIAQTMGLSLQAVKSLLNRAKESLRLKLSSFFKKD